MGKLTTETADLKLEKLSKNFGKVRAVKGVSLEIPHGELVTLLGPSGCGKTTLLNLIGGLDKPTKGEVIIDGTNITQLKQTEIIDFRLRISDLFFKRTIKFRF